MADFVGTSRLLGLRRRRFSVQASAASRAPRPRAISHDFGDLSADWALEARGTGRAPADTVSQLPVKTNSVQAQVELLASQAKKHSSARNELQALECYRQAAELMLGAPWLQHRTAELARKLKQPELAAVHYRRAALAFIAAGFPKRALAPMRNAWQSSLAGLPAEASGFVTLTLELAHVQRELGFAVEAALAIENANRALELSGSQDRVPVSNEPEIPQSGLQTEDLRRLA
jgi:hypothetical protein